MSPDMARREDLLRLHAHFADILETACPCVYATIGFGVVGFDSETRQEAYALIHIPRDSPSISFEVLTTSLGVAGREGYYS